MNMMHIGQSITLMVTQFNITHLFFQAEIIPVTYTFLYVSPSFKLGLFTCSKGWNFKDRHFSTADRTGIPKLSHLLQSYGFAGKNLVYEHNLGQGELCKMNFLCFLSFVYFLGFATIWTSGENIWFLGYHIA